MNCREVELALIEVDDSVDARLPPQAQDHVKGCKRCQDLVRALSTPVLAGTPLPAILRQIQRDIAADLRPVRPVAPERYLLAAFIGIFISIVAFGVYRMGSFAIAVMSPLQAGVILVALATSTA